VQTNEIQEILNWYDIITQQNYFTFNKTIYTQTDGLAMGAPSSSIISEIFLQHIECNTILSILNKHCILGYYRYVDDILILFDSSFTHIQSILHDFNNLHHNLNYTVKSETNNSPNYLDITIHRTNTNLNFHIFRKPTFTDTIIPQDSCHPPPPRTQKCSYTLPIQPSTYLQFEQRNQSQLTQHHNEYHSQQQIPPANI
jgi:hypothetical protein